MNNYSYPSRNKYQIAKLLIENGAAVDIGGIILAEFGVECMECNAKTPEELEVVASLRKMLPAKPKAAIELEAKIAGDAQVVAPAGQDKEVYIIDTPAPLQPLGEAANCSDS